MNSTRSQLRVLLDAGHVAVTVLSRLADVPTPPEAGTCLHELHYATTWFCAGLEKHISRAERRRSSDSGATAQVVSDRMMAAPAVVDRLRLVNRSQRWVLARVDGLLAAGLEPELRAFLEEARVILARSVHCCDDAISVLDRDRELRREPDR